MSKSKYWCATINNPDEDECEHILDCARWGPGKSLTYLIAASERGESGTPHLQCYLEFSKRVSLLFLRQFVNERGHYEQRGGSSEQADVYCRKEDADPFVFGVISVSRQGRRSDLAALQEVLDAGATIMEVATQHFSVWARNHNAIRIYRSLRSEPRDFPTTVFVLWGGTGTGKSRYCHWRAGSDLWTCSSATLQWFDGYDGQSHVLFDEFTGSGVDFKRLLQLADRYPCDVAVKGTFVNWRPRFMWLISNDDPATWWDHTVPAPSSDALAAWDRRVGGRVHRFERVLEFHGSGGGPMERLSRIDEVFDNIGEQ